MAIHHNSHKRTTEHSAVPRLAFSMHEAATALGLSPGKIRLMIEAGELAAVHAGRRRLIPRESLQAFLNPGAE
jgi:excisionase family DNA binding protein